jgi:hypothetical protein
MYTDHQTIKPNNLVSFVVNQSGQTRVCMQNIYDRQGDVPLPRAASAVARIDSVVFLFGGRHRTTRMNDLHCLDLLTLTWTGE